MKKHMIGLLGAIMIVSSVSSAHAANVGFNLGINFGNVLASVGTYPDQPPEFVAQPGLGFYMAVGSPYDMFYAGSRYYLCRGNMWYAAPYYNGPWVQVGFNTLPWGLRRYPIARLRYMRNERWGHYRGGDYDGYRHFRPEWRGRRDMQARWEGGRPCGMGGYRHGMRRDDDD